MTAPDLAALPGLPKDVDGPVFAEPWQAQAFALTVELHSRGAFTWTEWADALSQDLKAAGPDDEAERYYDHWLAALERLVTAKQLAEAEALHELRDRWEIAYQRTPHGQPVSLAAADNPPVR